MNQLLMVIGIIISGFLIGYVIQYVVRLKKSTDADKILIKLRRLLQVCAILVLHPVAVFSSIWALEVSNIEIFFLPFMGILTMVAGGAAGLVLARLMSLSRTQTGAFYITSSISNTASIGGLIVYSVLGEIGYALVPIFRLLEEITCYTIGFPIAKSFSPELQEVDSLRLRIVKIFIDPYILVTIGSILLGFVLNLSGLLRPAVFSQINMIIIPISTLFLLISIGVSMRFSIVGQHVWKAFAVAGIKYIFVPFVVIGTSALLGLGSIDNGLPLKVVAILSSMPVAFFSLVPVSVYKLDLDLANSTWLVSTALLLVEIPILMMVLRLLG